MIESKFPTSIGVSDTWSLVGAATKYQAVTEDTDDTKYIYTSTVGVAQEFGWPTSSVGTAATDLIMAVRLVVTAKVTTGVATMRFTARRGHLSTDELESLPINTAFGLTTTYQEYSITLCNWPWPNPHGHDAAWTVVGAEWQNAYWGVMAQSIGDSEGGPFGDVRVTQLRLDIITRPVTTLDDILTSTSAQLFQWAEIEGIKYVPTTQALSPSTEDWSVGAYYYGMNYRPWAGTLLLNSKITSAKINHGEGKEEYDNASLELLDTPSMVHEHKVTAPGATNPTPIYQLQSNGWYSWLFAYADRATVKRSYMVSSVADVWNTVHGLDPMDWGGTTYGRRFRITSGESGNFPTLSHIYVGRETIYLRQKTAPDILGGSGIDGLRRGEFGSLNREHDITLATGVLPVVATHPTSWVGRWVRIWTNAIDPQTGLPFPMSLAFARTFTIDGLRYHVGASHNAFSLSLGPMERLLQGPSMPLTPARAKRLCIGPDPTLGIPLPRAWFVEAQEEPPKTFLETKVTLSKRSFRDAQELCDDLNDRLVDELPTDSKAQWHIGIYGDRCKVAGQGTTGKRLRFRFDGTIADALGFDTGESGDCDNIDDWKASGTKASYQQFWMGKKPVAITHTAYGIDRQYIETDDDTGWPTVDGSNSAGHKWYFRVGDGDDAWFFNVASAVTTDSDGDYFSVNLEGPNQSLTRGNAGDKPPLARLGDAPHTVTPILAIIDRPAGEICAALLTSTGFGNNGTYDLYPRRIGLGIHASLVNTAAIAAAGNRLPLRERTYYLDGEISIRELIAEELKWPQGLILTQDDQGRMQWSIVGIPTVTNSAALPPILDEHFVGRSAVTTEHGQRHIVNTIETQVDYDLRTRKFRRKIVVREPNSIRLYGERKRSSEHHGIQTARTGQGYVTTLTPETATTMLAEHVFRRFAFEVPTVQGQLSARGMNLRPGQPVLLTSPLVHDPSSQSARGVTGRPAEVMRVSRDLTTRACEVELLCDPSPYRIAGYAPAALINTWSSPTATLYPYEFTPYNGSKRDIDYFTVGDEVWVIQGNAASPSAIQVGIATIDYAAGTMTFDEGLGFTPTNRAIIAWAGYGPITTAQKAKLYCHICAAGGTTIDSGDLVEGFFYAVM